MAQGPRRCGVCETCLKPHWNKGCLALKKQREELSLQPCGQCMNCRVGLQPCLVRAKRGEGAGGTRTLRLTRSRKSAVAASASSGQSDDSEEEEDGGDEKEDDEAMRGHAAGPGRVAGPQLPEAQGGGGSSSHQQQPGSTTAVGRFPWDMPHLLFSGNYDVFVSWGKAGRSRGQHGWRPSAGLGTASAPVAGWLADSLAAVLLCPPPARHACCPPCTQLPIPCTPS